MKNYNTFCGSSPFLTLHYRFMRRDSISTQYLIFFAVDFLLASFSHPTRIDCLYFVFLLPYKNPDMGLRCLFLFVTVLYKLEFSFLISQYNNMQWMKKKMGQLYISSKKIFYINIDLEICPKMFFFFMMKM